MMEWLNDRSTYVTGHSTPAGQFNRGIPRLFLVKGDTAASKLNRHALDSELTKGMRADLLLRPCEVLSGVPNPTILEVAHNALRSFLQHRHMLVGGLA